MKISTKGRYGLKAVMEIARQADNGHVSMRDLSQTTGISASYLEQLFKKLRAAGVLRSVRGAQGGYALEMCIRDSFISEWLEPIFKRYTFHEMDDLYAAVGCGGVSTNQILQRLIEECQKKHKQERKAELLEKAKQAAHRANQNARTPSHGVIVKGQENMLVRMAHCCRPVPGDPIVGFITRGRGVSIHLSLIHILAPR